MYACAFASTLPPTTHTPSHVSVPYMRQQDQKSAEGTLWAKEFESVDAPETVREVLKSQSRTCDALHVK